MDVKYVRLVAGTVIPVSDKVKILSATLDSNLTVEPHTKTLCIRSLRFVRPWMTAWLVPWRLRLFHPILIMLTLSYTVRR